MAESLYPFYSLDVQLQTRDYVAASGLAPCVRHVLRELSSYVNAETGEAWPAVQTLKEVTGLGLRTVKRSLKTLRDKGIIQAREVAALDAKPRPTKVYRLTYLEPDYEAEIDPPEDWPEKTGTGLAYPNKSEPPLNKPEPPLNKGGCHTGTPPSATQAPPSATQAPPSATQAPPSATQAPNSAKDSATDSGIESGTLDVGRPRPTHEPQNPFLEKREDKTFSDTDAVENPMPRLSELVKEELRKAALKYPTNGSAQESAQAA